MDVKLVILKLFFLRDRAQYYCMIYKACMCESSDLPQLEMFPPTQDYLYAANRPPNTYRMEKVPGQGLTSLGPGITCKSGEMQGSIWSRSAGAAISVTFYLLQLYILAMSNK